MQKTLFLKLSEKKVIVRAYKLTDFTRCRSAGELRLANINQFDEEAQILKKTTYVGFAKLVRRFREDWRKKRLFVLGVFDRASGDHVGQVDIFVINERLRWVNLGYQIHNHHWSKGYATEAAQLTLNFAFKVLKFHRVEAAAETNNKASLQVAKRTGMKFEGIRKKFFSDNGGLDMAVYAANAIDYSKKRD